MKAIPKHIESWYMPCNFCNGEGNRPTVEDPMRLEGCCLCSCTGHFLTKDGQDAMDWIYRHVKKRLEKDCGLKDKKEAISKPSPEPELPFDPVGLSRYHSISKPILWGFIIGGIVVQAIHSWLGF